MRYKKGNKPVAGFRKGASGNPKGRPRLPEDLREAFKAQCARSLEVLVAIRDNAVADESVRVRACEVILNRALGTPTQMTELSVTHIPEGFLALAGWKGGGK